MQFQPPSTLASRSAVTHLSLMWSREIEKVIQKDCNEFFQTPEYWKKAGNSVVRKLNVLSIPAYAKQLLIDLAQPIGKEIQKWLDAHKFLNVTCKDALILLCWNNTKGTVDLKQTAEKVFPYVTDDISSFRLACMYCMEKEIFELWPLVDSYFEELLRDDLEVENGEVTYWIKQIQPKTDTVPENEDGFLHLGRLYSFFWQAMKDKKEIAVKYFLDQMEDKQRHRVLLHTLEGTLVTEIWRNTPIILLLLGYLDAKEQDDMLKKYPHGISLQLLNWPYQCFFLDTIRKVWGNLHERGYYIILENIIECISECSSSDIYKDILRQYWQESPDHFKKYTKDKCINSSFLVRLACAEGNDCAIQLIVQTFTIDEKRTLFLSMTGLMVVNFFIKRRRWDCLTMFLRECIPSEKADRWADGLLSVYYEAKRRTPFLLSIQDSDLSKLIEILKEICDPW